MDQFNLTGIYRTFHVTYTEYTYFSAAHVLFTKFNTSYAPEPQ